MVSFRWVEVSARALPIFHRAITEFVNMESMLAGLQPIQVRVDFHAVIRLLESYFARHSVIAQTMHHRNSVGVFVAARLRTRGAPRIARCPPSAASFLRLCVLKL